MNLQIALISAAGLLVSFFIGRSVMLWYWKIDKKLSLVERQNVLLEEQNQNLSDVVSMAYLLLVKEIEKIQIEDSTGSVRVVTAQEWKESYMKNKQVKIINVQYR